MGRRQHVFATNLPNLANAHLAASFTSAKPWHMLRTLNAAHSHTQPGNRRHSLAPGTPGRRGLGWGRGGDGRGAVHCASESKGGGERGGQQTRQHKQRSSRLPAPADFTKATPHGNGAMPWAGLDDIRAKCNTQATPKAAFHIEPHNSKLCVRHYSPLLHIPHGTALVTATKVTRKWG